MTRLIAIILTLLLAHPATKAQYSVYTLSGDITTVRGRHLRPRDPLAGVDIIDLCPSCRIKILDNTTRRVYSSTTTGRVKVSDIVRRADEDARDITRHTTDRIIAGLNRSGGSSRAGRRGLSRHMTNAGGDTTAITLCGLLDLPTQSPYDNEESEILLGRCILDDGLFTFTVFNTLSQPLYVNVLPKTANPTPYFAEHACAAPRRETIIDQYTFALPSTPEAYILVASPLPFNAADIAALLTADASTAAPFYFYLLR